MALKQGKHGKRGGTVAINPREAGNIVCVKYEMDLSAVGITAASDVIEFGPLPAYAELVDATIIGENIGAAMTATVGILSGEASNADNARALVGAGTNFITAGNVNNTETAATKANCKKIAKSLDHRGVGATVSADIAAGAGKKLTLVMKYMY